MMSKIHDNLHAQHAGFIFGLWAECPEYSPVAWGCRAIADRGCGFSLLHDRQTWGGEKSLVKAFSKAINSGPLKRAIEEAKRLRDGWTPYKVLEPKAFREFWALKMKNEPKLFESFSRSGSWMSPNEGMEDHYYKSPKEADPLEILDLCQEELRESEEYDERYQKMLDSGKDFPTPDPPPKCENEYDEDEDCGEDCGAEFKKVRGKWVGCEWEGDAWACDECGHRNYVEEDEDDEWALPKSPVTKAYGKIVGSQGGEMQNEKGELFTLYDDNNIVIKANTNGSHGYVYVIAYPKHDVVDSDKVKHSDKHPGFEDNGKSKADDSDVFWRGPFPIPQPGDIVDITDHKLGKATVIAHRVEDHHLFLVTVPDAPLPDWFISQNEGKLFVPSLTWNVMGGEISSEVIRATEGEE